VSVRERKQRERRARREAILAAAAKVFAAHGLDGATVEMVARQAEVAVGTIYLYFCSRDDLFLSLMAERIGRLRAHYLEIGARGLAAADEVRVIGAAYLDYLKESRGLFLAQLAVDFGKLPMRLSRPQELERFEQVRALGRECFNLWRDAVGRLLSGAGQAEPCADATRAATVIWAALNGAFLLTGDEEIFRDVTGIEAAGLLEQTFEFQLAAAQAAAARTAAVASGALKSGANATRAGRANGHASNGKSTAPPAMRPHRGAPATNG
jgi:AcrR family transcriptional regulator